MTPPKSPDANTVFKLNFQNVGNGLFAVCDIRIWKKSRDPQAKILASPESNQGNYHFESIELLSFLKVAFPA